MRFLLLAALAVFFTSPVKAQLVSADSEAPLEITADEALEWHREDKTFIARKNALAAQDGVTVAGDTLTADYREGNGKDMEVWRVTADGNVAINSEGSSATGDRAVYDVDSGTAVMTGSDLKLVSPDQTVTAEEKFEYWIADGKLVATGNAKAVRPKPGGGTDTLEASQIIALFAEDAQGKRVLRSLEAVGNVVITTPQEVLTGSRGTYSAASNIAELTGNVKIRRGENVLQGERAQANLGTNVSTMLGSSNITTDGSGRVRGVFYPGSEKKPEIQ